MTTTPDSQISRRFDLQPAAFWDKLTECLQDDVKH